MAENSLDVKLATYAERLDRYMETQESLNKRLVGSIEKLNTNVEALQSWRNRASGAKTSLIAVGILITQTVVIMGSLAALTGWTNNR
jgi:hypothetical protein|tara:strand:+ start:241 stop:501 length:261 start_codon:yes stop_codon:yes gene_type:complete